MLSGPLLPVQTSHRLPSYLPPPPSLQSLLPFILSSGLTSHCVPPAEPQGLELSAVGHGSLPFSPEPRSFCQDLGPASPQGSLTEVRQRLLRVGLPLQPHSQQIEGGMGGRRALAKHLSYARYFTNTLSFNHYS